MNTQEEQAKIMAVLRGSDEMNNRQSEVREILTRLQARHLQRASMNVTTQVINK